MGCNQGYISSECPHYLNGLDHMICCNILKTTDAGPGVSVSNTEVRFRDVEIAQIHIRACLIEITRLQGTLHKTRLREQIHQYV